VALPRRWPVLDVAMLAAVVGPVALAVGIAELD
jgi:hypothetical protein